MLYMVGKIFLYEISFNIVYNESGHKNMKHFDYFFYTDFREKNLFEPEMKGYETMRRCNTHIYLSNRTLQILIIS